MSRRDSSKVSPIQLIAAAERYGFMDEVDRWVIDLATDPVDQAMVRSITSIPSALGMEAMAEGVENRQIFASLPHHGVAFAQGFYISKPLSAPLAKAAALHQWPYG